MLKLKRVELQGFKSFCDRTELRFNGEGIAAIVGPNGCGKSNISDAISWVLGEQSAKSLRGARMEDVIFAGTRDRKPLGMAYVTMTLVDPELYDENAAHKLQPVEGGQPPKNAEVTITRRLYRSGESEYLIDGRAARLRDIQDLFMGTGLGPESYAIIEQGRIGQILSSKPQDRRAVIEEAAGITRFKTKKRLAEAKLEGAKQNLARVYDILEEVTRQVNSLKRQASKAKRYGELKIELDTRLRIVLGGKYRLLERDAAKTAIDLNIAAGELKSLGDQVAEREQAHEPQQVACYEIEYKLTEARQQLAERQVEAERTRGRLESQVKESGAIEQRIAQNEKDTQDLGVRLDALDEEIGGHKKNVDELEAQIAQARERMTEINQQREGLQLKVRERERAIEAGRQVILRLLGEASTLKNQLAQIEEYLAGIDRETARATREEAVAAAEIERLDIARKQLSDTVAQRQMELETVTGERRRTEEDLADRRKLAGELRREIDGVKTEVSQIRARKESLEQVLAHRTYTTESVKRLFASLGKGQGRRPQAPRRAGRLRGSGSAVRKARRRIPARRARVRGGAELAAGRARPRFHPRRTGRPRHLPGAPRTERPHPRPPARAGHRAGDRHQRAPQRFAAPHQRLQGSRHRPDAARLHVFPGRRSRRRAAPGGELSAPLFPPDRRRLLSRPDRDRRQEERRRSAGHEARSARTRGEAEGAAGGAG